MDMSVKAEGSLWSRLSSAEGFTSVAHIFVMEWAAVLRDIVLGLLIAGAVARVGSRQFLAASVPHGPPRAGPDLGSASRTRHLDLLRSSARLGTSRSPLCSGTAASALAVWSASSSPISSSCRFWSSTGSTTGPK